MSKKLQLRGGTTTEHASFTGAEREVTVDTDKETLVIHDGSTAGGFALPRTDAEIRTAVEAATDSNVFTDADHTKLNAIEASADVTDTANVVAALTAGSNITISAGGTIAGAAQYTHPTHDGDDAAIDTGALSGATVISDLDLNITTDNLGHVTDANATVATRNLTLGDLGFTGATNANYITNNNQLTNGAGYTTSVGDITGVTAGTNLTGGGTSGGVTVNLTASPNITSLSVGSSEVISSGRQLKNIASLDATTTSTINAVVGSSDLVAATGGTITTDGNFKVHKFTSNGTFTVTAAGGVVDVLVVSGGGRGGRGVGASGRSGGGGGAGGVGEVSFKSFTAGPYSVFVGAGSPAVTTETGQAVVRGGPSGVIGPDFYFTELVGGGGGGGRSTFPSSGDSGGGANETVNLKIPGNGSTFYGNDGGIFTASSHDGGTGGGGAGAAGGNSTSGSNGGDGGVGVQSSITGTATYYGGGGGAGGDDSQGAGGTGGGGGGGTSANTDSAGFNGTNGLGGGGGGGSIYGYGGAGGNGVVIFRYKFQ